MLPQYQMRTRKVQPEEIYDQMSPQNLPPKIVSSAQECDQRKKAEGKETSPYVYDRLQTLKTYKGDDT